MKFIACGCVCGSSGERAENNYVNVTDMYENVTKQICGYRDLNKP